MIIVLLIKVERQIVRIRVTGSVVFTRKVSVGCQEVNRN